MKIVLIGTVSSSIFGFRKPLLQSLVSAGHEVHILTTDLTEELRQRAWKDLGVRAEKYELARTGMNPLIDIKNAWKLYRRLKDMGPDLVFCYFAKPVIWGSLAACLADIRLRFGMLEGLGYYFTDAPDTHNFKKKFIRAVQIGLFYVSLPFLRGLVVLNPDDKRDLIEKYRIRQHNVMILGGIGVDLDEFAYSTPRTEIIRFIFVGRLLAEKGIKEYLKAAEILKERYPEVEFAVLGSTDPGNPGAVDEDYLQELVQKRIVIYPGSVKNVVDWLAGCSVFVLPSYREGVPRSTQEAMAVGRPVITTDVPGCRETVVDGENGYIVPPHDAYALAGAMEKFIKMPDLIDSMGKKSRIMAEEKFDADHVNRRLLEFLGVL